MIPGPANVISCPYCEGKKELMSLVSGNTFGGTVWSDTRRHYPMLPEVSPIQKCPHCGKYYFVEQAKSEYAADDDTGLRSFGELGTLNYSELKEAKEQMQHLTLTKMQRWIINHQLFMAYNDEFRRNQDNESPVPTKEDAEIFEGTVQELLEGIDSSEDYNLFHTELLRETGMFGEAMEILKQNRAADDRWVVEAMMKHIINRDTQPFLLIKNGNRVDLEH
ncbi:MAG: hypothetical protein K2N35_04945 [Muribaculaceae bacterium]|nr:hypothetical protein [Muribaculaceae bacterium]